jgi:predicted nucleotidyltransferase
MLNSKDIQEQIAARFKEPPRPFKVVLFGSYARGTPHHESDIDLLQNKIFPGGSILKS